MSIFDAFKNKSGKSQKTSYSCGNKYVTEGKKTKNGGIKITTKPVKRNAGRGR